MKTRPLCEGASVTPQKRVNHLYNKRNRNFSCADYTIIDRGEKSMDPKIEDLVLKMERSRAKLNAALDRIAPYTEITPAWNVKQVMDHIAGWDELVYSSLQAYKNGASPKPMVDDGIDPFNAALSRRTQRSVSAAVTGSV